MLIVRVILTYSPNSQVMDSPCIVLVPCNHHFSTCILLVLVSFARMDNRDGLSIAVHPIQLTCCMIYCHYWKHHLLGRVVLLTMRLLTINVLCVCSDMHVLFGEKNGMPLSAGICRREQN